MKQYIFLRITILVISILIAATAFSQATRTWVSGVGDDVNPCSRTAPCKTFAGAISKTATGGEISVLDPGGYGAVTITKSMTIDGKGEQASILSSMVNGIIINAPGAVVTIRNISINGAGTGINGIRIMEAKKVFIEDCTLSGFTTKGIDIATTAPCAVTLNNVTIHNAMDAVGITNEGGSVTINDCRFQTVINNGINLVSGQVTVSNTTISDCRTAIMTAAKSSIFLSKNVISNNDMPWLAGGTITSAGNNLVAGNKSTATPVTVIKLQ